MLYGGAHVHARWTLWICTCSPRVAVEEPHSISEIQRLFLVLSPTSQKDSPNRYAITRARFSCSMPVAMLAPVAPRTSQRYTNLVCVHCVSWA